MFKFKVKTWTINENFEAHNHTMRHYNSVS